MSSDGWRQEDAAEAAGDEQRNEAEREQHRRGEADACAPHSVPSQLKVLMAEGTPMAWSSTEKAMRRVAGSCR